MSADDALLQLDAVALRTPERSLVDALTLRVAAGERWAVLGPNGAGKSTLLAAMAGARAVDGGTLRLQGRDVAQLRPDELARARALLTDRWTDPFACSVLETVLTARYVHADEAGAAAAAHALLERLDCAALAARDVRRLSRGERQRVALATALLQDTPLVLLDEPTAHQDPRHQALVMRELASLPKRALVASVHDLNAAVRFATHVLLLFGDGRTQAGPAAQVLTADAVSELFGTPITAVQANGERFFHVHGDATAQHVADSQ
jgi:iron complex transport system ATP-binding protein